MTVDVGKVKPGVVNVVTNGFYVCPIVVIDIECKAVGILGDNIVVEGNDIIELSVCREEILCKVVLRERTELRHTNVAVGQCVERNGYRVYQVVTLVERPDDIAVVWRIERLIGGQVVSRNKRFCIHG